MTASRVQFKVTAGPNDGDTLSLEIGTCRLVGRHLSDNETALIDRNGNRVLDAPTSDILSAKLKDRSPAVSGVDGVSSDTFERGADVILADDSISRAHAMLFFDDSGIGIIDLASTNGTFVNEERIITAMIGDGDAIGIGNSHLRVSLTH